MTHALSWARSRRRRRKPMPPWLKLSITVVVLTALNLLDDSIRTMLGHDHRIGMAGNAACIIVWWPILRHYWREWRRDT